MDVLLVESESLWFYERLPGDAFEKHKLMTNSIWDRFEVADWDGDRQLFDSYLFSVSVFCSSTCGSYVSYFLLQIFPLSFAGDMRPDILMCTWTLEFRATVRFLSHSVVLAGVTDISEHPAILQTNASHPEACDMQAVDFDEDGDLDLVMSKGPDPPREELDRIPSVEITESLMQEVAEFLALVPPLRFERYFERVLDELEERTGEQNPLQAFPDQVQQIADLDGDGRLDVLVAALSSAEKRVLPAHGCWNLC